MALSNPSPGLPVRVAVCREDTQFPRGLHPALIDARRAGATGKLDQQLVGGLWRVKHDDGGEDAVYNLQTELVVGGLTANAQTQAPMPPRRRRREDYRDKPPYFVR